MILRQYAEYKELPPYAIELVGAAFVFMDIRVFDCVFESAERIGGLGN